MDLGGTYLAYMGVPLTVKCARSLTVKCERSV